MLRIESNPSVRIFVEKEEVTRCLDRHHVDYHKWGTETPYTLARLLDTLRKNHVFLVENRKALQLHVHTAVAIVQHYHSGRLLELREEYQEFHHNKKRLVRGFRGVAETLLRDEFPLFGIYRALTEELTKLEPLFKEHWRYGLTHLPFEFDGPKNSEKWPGLIAFFHRNIYHCMIHDPELYRADGYIEVQEDKTSVFKWHEVPTDDPYRLLMSL